MTSGATEAQRAKTEPTAAAPLAPIRISEDGSHFVRGESGERFTPWGFNYTHDSEFRLLEEFWASDWETLVEDFQEMKALGGNVVRIHLQFATYMTAPETVDAESLARLEQILELAENTRLYLDITGLGCYHKDRVPAWYDALDEEQRWAAQARFWAAIAETCADSPAVFCYGLMNEPLLLAANTSPDEWLTGELAGMHFVQYITLDLEGRSREAVARAWTRRLVEAIRAHDADHLITLGVINWAANWPNAKPAFYAPDAADGLDFVSVHLYPRTGEIQKSLNALETYDFGRPLVVEETYPMHCTVEELAQFIHASQDVAEGWITHYFGKTVAQYDAESASGVDALHRAWLERAPAVGARLLGGTEQRRW